MILVRLAYRFLSAGGRHRYISTYCQHGRCEKCRLECKDCAAPCLCNRCDHTTEGERP